MKEQPKTEEILFEFIRNVLYKPEAAYIDVQALPAEYQELGEGLAFLGQCVREQKAFGKSLIKGDFDHNIPNGENGIAAPLKEVHGILKHLVWQSGQVAKGDYNQRLEHFGALSESFNSMVQQLREREEALRQKNQQLESLLDMFKNITSDAPYYIMILQNETGCVTYMNKSAENIRRSSPTLYDKIYKQVLSCHTDKIITIANDDGTGVIHYQVLTASHSGGDSWVYVIIDVTDELEQKLKLENMAYRDEMTGVNNRRYSQILMREMQKERRLFSLAFVDLDHLKYCNDVFGHESGDQYIKEVCHFLQKECAGTTVCRVGGDEFIVIKADATAAEMETQFERLSQKFITDYPSPFQKSFSYGIAACESSCPESISLALEHADRQMYRYKLEHKQKLHYQDCRI